MYSSFAFSVSDFDINSFTSLLLSINAFKIFNLDWISEFNWEYSDKSFIFSRSSSNFFIFLYIIKIL
jgi:hypothetical protein